MSSVATQSAFRFLKPQQLIAPTGQFVIATMDPALAGSSDSEVRHGEKPSQDEAMQLAQSLVAAKQGLQAYVFDDDGAVVGQV